MKITWGILVTVVLFLGGICAAQQAPAMAAPSIGFGPGDTFSVFVTLEHPMSDVGSMTCRFYMYEEPKPHQKNFTRGFNSDGSVQKIDETHYRARVSVPGALADGTYKLASIQISSSGVVKSYESFKDVVEIKITNPLNVRFSDIKEVKIEK